MTASTVKRITLLFALLLGLLCPPPAKAQDCGRLPALAQTLLQDLAAKFPDEIKAQTDEGRRVWAMRAAEQLAFSVSPEWGTKKASNGRPLTKDAVARVLNGRLCVWDVVDGKTRALRFGSGLDVTGQVFVAVTPRDHLQASQPPPPPPPPDLEARVRAVERAVQLLTDQLNAVDVIGRLDALEAAVKALEARPAGDGGGVDEARVRAILAEALAALALGLRTPR